MVFAEWSVITEGLERPNATTFLKFGRDYFEMYDRQLNINIDPV